MLVLHPDTTRLALLTMDVHRHVLRHLLHTGYGHVGKRWGYMVCPIDAGMEAAILVCELIATFVSRDDLVMLGGKRGGDLL